MQAIKDKTLELYKEKKGRLNSVDLYGIQSEWNKLKSEAEASNSLYAEEQNRIKALEEDPTGVKYDAVESQKLRDLYRDPMSNPELAKEVQDQFGGSVIKWRANNERRFANVGAYNIAEDIDKYAKDKASKTYAKIDKSGKPIFEPDQFGILSTPVVTGVDKEKMRTSYNTFYDRTDYKGKKFREEVGKMIGRNYDINENGDIQPNNNEVATIDAFKSALSKFNPSMSAAQKAEILRKEYGLSLIKSQYKEDKTFEYGHAPSKASSSEDKKAFTALNNGSGYSAGGFTFINEDASKYAGLGQTYLGKIVGLDKAQKALRVNTESTSALPKEILITKGSFKGQQIAPNVIMKTKSGKYYVEGQVSAPDPDDATGEKKIKKVTSVEVTPIELQSAFNLKQSELDEMFKGESAQKSTPSTGGTPSNKPTGTGKKKLPGT